MSSDATWLRGLQPRLPGVTVGRGPSRLYQREASVYPTASVYPARGVLACGVIACRFSCIAYLALAVPSVLKQDLQDEQDFQD